jgi:hypothetical protein
MKPFALLTALLLTGVVMAGDMPTDQLPTDQFPTDQIPTDQMPSNFPTDQKPAEFMGGWDGTYESLNGWDRGSIGIWFEKQNGWDFQGRMLSGGIWFEVQGLVDADGRCAMVGTSSFEPNRTGDEGGLIVCKSPTIEPPQPDLSILMVGQVRVDERGETSFAGYYIVVSKEGVVDIGVLELMHKPY